MAKSPIVQRTDEQPTDQAQIASDAPRMSPDGVTPARAEDAIEAKPARSKVVRLHTGKTPEQMRSERKTGDFSGYYRVTCYRLGLPCIDPDTRKADPLSPHETARAGDLVYLTHDDAMSALRLKAVETEAAYERRIGELERERIAKEFADTAQGAYDDATAAFGT